MLGRACCCVACPGDAPLGVVHGCHGEMLMHKKVTRIQSKAASSLPESLPRGRVSVGSDSVACRADPSSSGSIPEQRSSRRR
eukprot:809104-Pelagomonas_calceolata.AAC.2